MRGTAAPSYVAVAALAAAVVMLAIAPVCAAPMQALFWSPSPAPGSTKYARRILAHALASRGIALDDAVIEVRATASLRPSLDHAIDDYGAMRIQPAVDALQALAIECARTGGGDLDRRGLGDLFLYLGLAHMELGHNDLAWDAFVASVRVDPTRTIDPARVPPRAAAAFRRAIAEQARAPQVEVVVTLPKHARLRIDGEEQGHDLTPLWLSSGSHFVQVESDGDEPLARTLTAAPPQTVFAPVLEPQAPPDLAKVSPPQGAALLAAVYRRPGEASLRLLLRGRTAQGRYSEASDVIDAELEQRVSTLVDTVLGAAPLALVSAPQSAPRPLVRRWWLWTAVGIGVAALAVGLPIGLTRGHHEPHGTVGGGLVPLQ